MGNDPLSYYQNKRQWRMVALRIITIMGIGEGPHFFLRMVWLLK